MKLAMAQMRMGTSVEENLEKTLRLIEQAEKGGADLIFFPEVQLSPFFPQYEKADAERWAMAADGPEITAIRDACRKFRIHASPNVYLKQGKNRYDASLMIGSDGEILGISKMVHIAQAKFFYEQDYYTPSDDGFKVYDTPFGKIGVVICFDRHLPDGIRSCAKQGAELVIIPTANILGEPLELFEWEVQVQAFQNTVFTAMCNRVGPEGELAFAGQSLLAAPDGGLQFKAGGEDELYLLDVPLEEARQTRISRPWLTL
ncbi:carbon-nitrogen hydrolase family protein [Oscillibacter valericigenes]|uniref:carbon-nitrogen hydrolase family protein n=1 Tax=Oscillibacter valericigenes TaxID=351091 RepID=UPI001F176A14|nr:carbon-nitrogen hydrolase family protein [Oscillibacter valericigenes]MCF2616385.1 carbon-nitrogen hydrolase family protein [Oscillibacter valericigenes]